MVLRRFQQAGHRPIAVVGGATGMIGDPSGKSEERNLLSLETLAGQHRRHGAAVAALPRFRLRPELGPAGEQLRLDGPLRLPGVPPRRGQALPRQRDAHQGFRPQPAGADRRGPELHRVQLHAACRPTISSTCTTSTAASCRSAGATSGATSRPASTWPGGCCGVQLYGCTCPLLTKSDGTKMGKTESGALWLSPERTSPYQFYQYWINLDDAEVGRCLRFFTDLGQDEIEALLAEHQADPGRRVAQRRLAGELTRLVHGADGLRHGRAGDGDLLRRRDQRAGRRPTGRHLRRRAEQGTAAGAACGRRACR